MFSLESFKYFKHGIYRKPKVNILAKYSKLQLMRYKAKMLRKRMDIPRFSIVPDTETIQKFIFNAI